MAVPLVYVLGAVGREIAVNVASEYIARGIDKLIDYKKEVSEIGKEVERQNKAGSKVDLRMLEMRKCEIEFSNTNKAQKEEMLKLLNKEKDELIKKNKLNKDEIDYEQAKGIIIALNKKAKLGSLSEEEKLQFACSKEIADRIATQPEEMLIEEQTIKASIAGYNSKKKAQEEAAKAAIQIEIEARRQAEERIKAEAKEFDDNMKKKEEAMKSLAGFDERMKIASLDGEAQKQAQLLANYEKQKAEIEALHEAQLLYAENEEQVFQEQANRMLEMEMQYQEQSKAIKDEYAEMEAQRRQAEDEAARAMAEQRKREEEELRDLKYQTAEATMSTISNVATLGAALSENHQKYANVYKVSAIGEAVINATQSVPR